MPERDTNGRWKKGSSGNPNGARRKPETLSNALRRRVEDPEQRKALLDALWAAALGHWEKDTDKKGEERVYLVGPQVKALALIFDRLEGRPAQRQEISGPDGGALLVGRMTPEERREYLEHVLRALQE